MDLNALRSLMAVVSHGGFAAAGRKLDLPKSTLSRRVRELEDGLQVRLLDRSSRSLRLTAEGELLCERAARALAEIEDVERELHAVDGPPRGPLRIAVPQLFAHRHMGRIAAEYHAAYPDVALEIVLADRVGDLVSEGFDAAVVIDAPEDEALVSRTLAREELIMVAPPSLLRARKRARIAADEPWPAVVPLRPRRGAHQRFLPEPSDPTANSRVWPLHDGGRPFRIIARPVMRLASKLMIREAAIAGAGAALLPAWMIEGDLAAGTLVRVGTLEALTTISIVHPSQRLVSGRLRAFIDLLVRHHKSSGSAAPAQREPPRGSAAGPRRRASGGSLDSSRPR